MRNIAVLTGLLVLFFTSCKKPSDPVPPTPFHPPADTTLSTASPMQAVIDVPAVTTYIYNSWGRLIALKSDSVLINFTGDTTRRQQQSGLAIFTDSANTSFLDAGNSSLNGVALNHHGGPYPYSGLVSNLNDSCHWLVAGSSDVPGFKLDFDGTFPTYTGTLPYVVSKSAGLSFNFNSNTLPGADSVYVVITTINTNSNVVSFSKIFSATAGSVTITGSEFNYLPDNPVYKAALMLVPFKYTTAAFGDKKFLYVKQSEIMHNVTIN